MTAQERLHQAALVLHACYTDEETNETVQRLRDVIDASTVSVSFSTVRIERCSNTWLQAATV